MLGPLALMHFNDTNWGKLMTSSINGWNLSFISRNLPVKTYFNSTMLLHIHWHSKYTDTGKQGLLKKSSFTRQQLLVLWDMLHHSVAKWKTGRQPKNWSVYYESSIESEGYLSDKTDLITNWLAEINPDRVVDLGANNGRFSLIASLYAGEVVAVESDHACVDELYRHCKQKKISNITTILSDIAQPTPGVGWNNAEHTSLFNRLNCDVVMALALLHHLCISKNVPLAFTAQLLAGITEKYAIVEFVPRSDAKIQQMLANREDIFDDYTEANFISSFQEHFQLVKSHQCLLSNRKIFLWRRKG
jgi:fibrillarin-like rRNA methylase